METGPCAGFLLSKACYDNAVIHIFLGGAAMKHTLVMLGEAMLELRPHRADLLQHSFAGDVLNTAIYLQRSSKARLDVQFFSAIGTDALSDQLLAFLQYEQIGTELLYRSQHALPGLYLVQNDAEGERSFHYWREASAARKVMQCYAAEPRPSTLDGCRLFYLTGISLAMLSPVDRQQLFQLIRALKTQGCRVVFDANYRPSLWQNREEAAAACLEVYALADLVLSGLDDQRALFGHESLEQACDWLQLLGVKESMLKDGANGAVGDCDGQRTRVAASPVRQVVDTTSAGDAFNGGYLAARWHGLNALESARYAARLAAFVVQHPGAIVKAAAFASFDTLP